MNNLRLDAVCSKQDEFEVILPWLHQRSGFEIKHGMYPRFSDFSFSKMSSRSHFTQNLTELFTLSEKPIMIVNQFPGPFLFPVTFEGINMNEKYSQIHSISIYINGERWFELPNLIVHVLAVGWSESTARFCCCCLSRHDRVHIINQLRWIRYRRPISDQCIYAALPLANIQYVSGFYSHSNLKISIFFFYFRCHDAHLNGHTWHRTV